MSVTLARRIEEGDGWEASCRIGIKKPASKDRWHAIIAVLAYLSDPSLFLHWMFAITHRFLFIAKQMGM